MSESGGVFSSLADSWPSTFVARSEVSRFSGGILNARTMANLDSLGRGPKGKISVGRKIAYRVESLIAWLEERAKIAAEG